MKRWSRTQQVLSTALIALHLGSAASSMAAPLELSNVPLFLTTKTIPNILFLLDNTATMDTEVMTTDNARDNALTGTQRDGTSPAGAGTLRHRDTCNIGDASMALG